MEVIQRLRFPRRPILSLEWRRGITQFLIVLAVVGLSYLAGVLAGSYSGRIMGLALMGLVIVVVSMLFLAEHLHWGIIMLMILATFSPLSLPTGTSTRLPDGMVMTLILIVLWVLRMFVVEKRFHIVPSPVNVPLLGFSLVTALSLVWSILFRDPQVYVWDSFVMVQAASTVMIILLPGAFLLIVNFGRDKNRLMAITWIMIVAGTIGLAVNYFETRMVVNSFGLFSMWVIALSMALSFFQKTLGRIPRLILFALVAGWIVWGFVLHISWVAGWLPGMIALGVITFMRSRKLFMFLVFVVLIIAIIFNGYFLERIEEERAESGDSRVTAWEVNWRVTGQHLLFGTGPGGYTAYYMTYYPHEGMATHNNYVDVIAQTGIIGLIFFLWFFGALAWQGFRLCLRLRGRGDFYEGLANAAFAGTIACIIIMMFGDWLLPFAYTQTIGGYDYAAYSWIFMGTIVAIDHLVPKPGMERA